MLRLELMAAVLADRMGSHTQPRPEFAELNFWAESMIVLHYSGNEKSEFNSFVVIFVSTVHCLTEIDQWRLLPFN